MERQESFDPLRPREVYEEAWRCIRNGNSDGLLQLCAPNFRLVMPIPIGPVNATGLREAVRLWRLGFSDFGQFRDVTILLDDHANEQLAARYELTATHDGVFNTPLGPFMPSLPPKTLTQVFADFLVMKDGKILTWEVFLDPTNLVEILLG